ncbi:MAG: ATP-binding protein [Bacteroidetes bacterium]|nr:ATP-binding protein [Bacteroidota bacterium]
MKIADSPEVFFSEEPMFDSDGLLNTKGLERNNAQLEKEYAWIENLFEKSNQGEFGWDADALPDCPFTRLVGSLGLSRTERILLLLSLEPHYSPANIIKRVSKLSEGEKQASTLGYYLDPFSGNYYPTLQTLFLLCADTDPAAWRVSEQEVIHRGRLMKEQIILLREVDERVRIGNRLNSLIDLATEYVDYLLHGRRPRPDFGRSFPARWVTTNLGWEQLVLNKITRTEIDDVMDWVAHGKEVIKRTGGKINKSFPVLFYGPPGTGKSFTAKLIGKQYGKDVFRIDLSMIVSKYIGETEKNLAYLFDRAESKDWILFFDEADALFGKRTGISDSKDKWANLEMSYLLQRMEEHEGLCILATNLKHNLDPALTRRFQALIHFPFPKPEERIQIWEKSIPPGFEYTTDISFSKLAHFELSGAGIANVIKASCVKATKRGDHVLNATDISRFIRIEYAKDSRTP